MQVSVAQAYHATIFVLKRRTFVDGVHGVVDVLQRLDHAVHEGAAVGDGVMADVGRHVADSELGVLGEELAEGIRVHHFIDDAIVLLDESVVSGAGGHALRRWVGWAGNARWRILHGSSTLGWPNWRTGRSTGGSRWPAASLCCVLCQQLWDQ